MSQQAQKGIASQPRRLLSAENRHWQSTLERLREFIGGEAYTSDGMLMPRFGALSNLSHAIPVYAFDDEKLRATLMHTFKQWVPALTDGRYVLMDVHFLEGVEKLRKEHGGDDILYVLLHELSHIMMRHSERRMVSEPTPYERYLDNVAKDVLINILLQDGFADAHKPGQFFTETAWGLQDEEMIKACRGLSEREIYYLLQEKFPDKLRPESDFNQDSQPGEQGEGQPGDGQQGEGQPGDGQQGKGQKGKPGQGSAKGGAGKDAGETQGAEGQELCDEAMAQGEDNNPVHEVSPDELREILHGADAGHIADKICPKNAQETKEAMEATRNHVNDAVFRAQAQDRASGGKMPGKGLTDAMSERIEDLHKARGNWQLSMREMLLGQGTVQLQQDGNAPNPVTWHNHMHIGLADPIFEPDFVLHCSDKITMVLVDTSGSVDNRMLKTFLEYIWGLYDEASNDGRRIMLVPADTVIRGDPEPMELEEFEMEMQDKGIDMMGRGGTDLGQVMCEAAVMIRERNLPVDSMVYFTDLMDYLYTREDFPEEVLEALPPRILFVVPEGARTRDAERKLEDYAEIREIPNAEYEDEPEFDLVTETHHKGSGDGSEHGM